MLQKLSIQNYAIIDELEIDFSGKLNIITGETGAGKSIIVGALGLILGERADSSVLVNKQKKCFVEGVFSVNGNKEVRSFLLENELDESDELVIRREIAVNGKSRAFINDTPVNLASLNLLGCLLVDLHQQFDTLSLGESKFQRDVLDALAGNKDLLEQFRQLYHQLQQAKKEFEDLNTQKLQFDKEFDYNQFQYKELADVGLKENELEDLDIEMKLLSHSEGIKSALTKVSYDLNESDTALVQHLKTLLNQLQNYSEYHPDLPALVERLQSSYVELQDIADETERLGNHIQYDPLRVEEISERMSVGYRLMKKHGVKTTNELLSIQKQLGEKLEAVFSIGDQILQKENQVLQLTAEARSLALKISERRKKEVKSLEGKVNKLLVQVGMPNARLKVEITDQAELNPFGINMIEFLFDANLPSGSGKSDQFQPLRKVASGGELSRLMLCIKSLVAQTIDLPTMIFDEIDTGISGEAARQVGVILKQLASSRQVISITHQPQIAGKADQHLLVYKEIVGDKVRTGIRKLSVEERVNVIARMLSGEKPTAAAMENAREMVG